jgi:hypothetical protein
MELLAETGLDVSGDHGHDIELSDEAVRGADDMLEYSIANGAELQ